MGTTKDEGRDARMYDEHAPPRPGIETDLMKQLSKSPKPRKPDEFIQEMQGLGYPESDVRMAIWLLVDRGYIEFTSDWNLRGRKNPLSPAPVDWD